MQMTVDIIRESYVVLAAPLSRTVSKISVKTVSEYDQELPKSHTVDQPTAR